MLARWHALANMAANPLTPDEQAQLGRAQTGDFTGFSVRDELGTWTTLSPPPPSTSTPEDAARCQLVWLQITDLQYRDLLDDLRALVDRRIAALPENPAVGGGPQGQRPRPGRIRLGCRGWPLTRPRPQRAREGG